MSQANNQEESLKYAKQVFNLEEYYSIEDYGQLLMVQTCLQNTAKIDFLVNSKINLNKNNQTTSTTIRANFYVNGKAREVLMEKSILKKVYAICKIISENYKFIKILIHRSEQYDTNEILNKINEIRIFKGAFKINLNIDEFPIKTYFLEENKYYNKDNNIDDIDIEKEFFLKKIPNNPNNVNQNKVLNNSGQTQILLHNTNNNQNNNNSLNSNNNDNLNLNNNINNRALVNNNNNIQDNNNINQQNTFINMINNYFNQNFSNLMSQNNCLIQILLFKNKFFLSNIINYILQNNNNPMNCYLLPKVYNIIANQNTITPTNLDNLPLIKEELNNFIKQIENFMIQKNNNNMIQMNNINMNQMNNYNQMNQINNYNQINQINNNNQINQFNNNIMNQSNNNINRFNNNIMNQSNNNINQFNNNIINQSNNNINQFNNNIVNQSNNNSNNNQINQINQINQTNNNQMNQINNINQIYNDLKVITMNLKEISKNIDTLFNLSNKNFNRKDNQENINNNDQKDNIIFKTYENYFPLIGLKNVGLTCYMNSILQCLLHIPQLNAFFINIYPDQKKKFKEINKETETHGRLCEEYYKIVIKIYNLQNFVNNYISPKDFNDVLSHINGQFAQFEANDAKDLLLYLFQSMHAELNYLGDKKLKNVPKCNQTIEGESFNFFMTVNNNLNLSIISYLFYGINKSTTICSECKTTLYNFQYFQFLSFPTYNFQGKVFNIYQGFKEFIKSEKMSGDNQCYCQKCKGLQDAKVTTKIYSAPLYLIINIDYGKNKKYKPKKVNFGGLIDITGFTDESNKCPNIQYELIAVSTHIGRSGSTGHYITYCKKNENIWYEFNDSSVSETKFDYVNSNTPYILIYKKR